MGLSFWHLLLTRDLPASITIILHQHTPLIIIGVADVASNSCLRLHMPRYELRALDFVYMHHIILLYRTNPSSRTLAYNLPSAFFGLVQFIHLACHFPSHNSKEASVFFFIPSRTCVSHNPWV